MRYLCLDSLTKMEDRPGLAVPDLSYYGYKVLSVAGQGRFGLVISAATINPASGSPASVAIKLIERSSIREESAVDMQREIANHATIIFQHGRQCHPPLCRQLTGKHTIKPCFGICARDTVFCKI